MAYWEVLNKPGGGRYGCYRGAKTGAIQWAGTIKAGALILYRATGKKRIPNPPSGDRTRVHHYVDRRGKVEIKKNAQGQFIDHPNGKGL